MNEITHKHQYDRRCCGPRRRRRSSSLHSRRTVLYRLKNWFDSSQLRLSKHPVNTLVSHCRSHFLISKSHRHNFERCSDSLREAIFVTSSKLIVASCYARSQSAIRLKIIINNFWCTSERSQPENRHTHTQNYQATFHSVKEKKSRISF